MDADVQSALKKDCGEGLDLAEAKLAAGRSFNDLKTEAKAKAYKGCCGNHIAGESLMVQCRTCMKGTTSCMCLDCFQRGNHADHDVIISQSTGVCDCGDINSMIQEAFCDKHQGVLPDPDVSLLDEATRERFPPVLLAVATHMAAKFGSEEGEMCRAWLEEFFLWGDGYTRLVVNAVLAGPIDKMMEIAKVSGCADQFFEFINAMITDRKMKVWVADRLDADLDTYRTSILNLTKGRVRDFPFLDEFYKLSVQVYTRADVMWQAIIDKPFFKKASEFDRDVICNALEDETEAAWTMLNSGESFWGSLCEGMRFRAVGREMIFEKKALLEALVDDFEWRHFAKKSKRHTEVKPADDDQSELFATFIGTTLLGPIVLGFMSVADKCGSVDSTADKPKFTELSEENRGKVLSVLRYVAGRYKDWDRANPHGLNVLRDEYSVCLCLDRLVLALFNQTVGFYQIPWDVALNEIGVEDLWVFAKDQMACLAALHYRTAYKTERFKGSATRLIITNNSRGNEQYPMLYHNLLLYRMSENHPERFVQHVVEVWGLTKWLNSDGAENEERIDINTVLSLVMRFFVQSMSDYYDDIEYNHQENVRRTVMHWLHLVGTGSSHELAERTSGDMEYMSALHAVGAPHVSEKEKLYKLRPELCDEVSPFWISYEYRDFLRMLTPQPGKSMTLLPLPKCATNVGKLTNRFAVTKEFSDLLIRVLGIMDKSLETYNEPTLLSVMAVIQMTVIVAAELGDYEEVTRLVKSAEFQVFSKKRQFLSPFASLVEFIGYTIKDLSDSMGDLRAKVLAELDKSTVRKGRPNMQAIMAAFRAKQSECTEQFADALAEISEEDGNEGLLCVYCHERINASQECYGLLWDDSLDLCTHYCHQRCHEQQRLPLCPICQVLRRTFVPILKKDSPESMMQPLTSVVSAATFPDVFNDLIGRLVWLLDFDHASEIGEAQTKLFQSLIISAACVADLPALPGGQPLEFAINLLKQGLTEENYQESRGKYGLGGEKYENICRVLWNIVRTMDDQPTVPSREILEETPEETLVDFSQLPKRFSDLFSELDTESMGLVAMAAKENLGGVCKCLTCGQFCTIRGSETSFTAHAREAGHQVFVVLSGRFASDALICNQLFLGFMNAVAKAIYLTEYDDEDEGLRFGCQLFLSEARVNEVRRNLVAGVYTRVTMEDIARRLPM